MPRSPNSPPEATRGVMSMNGIVVEVPATLENLRTDPPCCTTNQRDASPGACSARIGEENERAEKTRCTLAVSDPVGRAPARQVVLLGRVSSPPPATTAGVVTLAIKESAETFAGDALSYARTV